MGLPKIVIIDDDVALCQSMAKVLSSSCEVRWVTHCSDLKGLVQQEQPQCLLLDLNLQGASGLALLEQAQAAYPHLPVIMITGETSVTTAVEAMKKGAFHYLKKPVTREELLVLVEKAVAQRALYDEIDQLQAQRPETDLSLTMGPSDVVKELHRLVRAVATTDVNVLILGESGTGKELIAQTIHRISNRSDGPFVVVDCASLPESLIESELFGHLKGAFTGAHQDKQGQFAAANGGTLFLDELGNIPLTIQAKLLRFLESRQFQRVGSTEMAESSVRVIGATNAPLDEMARRQEFREDLYYRLNEFPLHLTPLRERVEDIPYLVRRFMTILCQELGRAECRISPQVMESLLAYDFPGNVRQLKNILKRSLVMAEETLEMKDLPPELRSQPSVPAHQTLTIPLPQDPKLAAVTQQVLEIVERQLIDWALQEHQGHQGQAAALLGVSPKTLYNKMKHLGLKAEA